MPDKIHVFKYLGWCAVCWRCRNAVAAGVSWEVALALGWDHIAEHRANPERLWLSPFQLALTRRAVSSSHGRPVRRPPV